jgi:hypothetical protein
MKKKNDQPFSKKQSHTSSLNSLFSRKSYKIVWNGGNFPKGCGQRVLYRNMVICSEEKKKKPSEKCPT